jgi:osmotically-inducible protein OsmY
MLETMKEVTMRYLILLSVALLTFSAYAQAEYVQDYSKSKGRIFTDNPKQQARCKWRANPTPQDLAHGPSALDQGNNAEDLAITRNIRKLIVDNDLFSNAAKNVTIITEDGYVTLKGVLRSQQEKDSIEAIARSISTVKSVNNQIIISK